jgi:hypothetical protein
MIYWITLLITVFITYTLFIYLRYGLLKAISQSYYELKEDKLGMLFFLFCLSLAIPLFAFYVETKNLLWIVASFGAFLTGAASAFESKHTRLAHFIGSIMLIAGSLISIWAYFGLWWPTALMAITIWVIVAMLKNNKVWWIEIAAFIIIISGLLKGIL